MHIGALASRDTITI